MCIEGSKGSLGAGLASTKQSQHYEAVASKMRSVTSGDGLIR